MIIFTRAGCFVVNVKKVTSINRSVFNNTFATDRLNVALSQRFRVDVLIGFCFRPLRESVKKKTLESVTSLCLAYSPQNSESGAPFEAFFHSPIMFAVHRFVSLSVIIFIKGKCLFIDLFLTPVIFTF